MKISIIDTGAEIVAYNEDGRQVGRFEPETFYLHVLSPRQLRSFERNPERKIWEVRKIDFNNHKKHLQIFNK
jgi:hypothetical protein